MKLIFEHGLQGHTSSESRQVGQVADDAVRVVGWTGETEADGPGLAATALLALVEPVDELLQQRFMGRRRRGDGERLDNFLIVAYCGELESSASGVEDEDDVVLHGFLFLNFSTQSTHIRKMTR